jgi:hypothetical protein
VRIEKSRSSEKRGEPYVRRNAVPPLSTRALPKGVFQQVPQNEQFMLFPDDVFKGDFQLSGKVLGEQLIHIGSWFLNIFVKFF